MRQRSSGPRACGPCTTSLALVALAGLAIGLMVYNTHMHKVRITAALQQAEAVVQAQAPPTVDYCSAEHIHKHTEYYGPVVVPGRNAKGPFNSAKSSEECCRQCQKQRGCNEWVFCHDPAKCGTECWLKREGTHSHVPQPGNNQEVPWTSGLIPKDFDVDPATLPPLDKSISHLVLTTEYGKIRIELKPDWSATSVEFVQRLAQQPELCGPSCQFYRAEPGFLLQGSLAAYIPANKVTKEGPKIMERGEIGWAGAGPGPDFFIFVGKDPATHFGKSHTVWGKVADEASMAVVERLLQLPATAPKPGDMHMMDRNVDFTPGKI